MLPPRFPNNGIRAKADRPRPAPLQGWPATVSPLQGWPAVAKTFCRGNRLQKVAVLPVAKRRGDFAAGGQAARGNRQQGWWRQPQGWLPTARGRRRQHRGDGAVKAKRVRASF
ncbi:hypothetical protein GW17_00044846 [Ensete ventricosum]|nr:hypothetical protein GW17_00044846 [Ensete ventricosum]